MPELSFQFPNAEKHAFVYENAHLMMLSWERDNAKLLFLIRNHDEHGLQLDFPGELFVNQVLDTVENIFFIQVNEGESSTKYALGSYFFVDGVRYGAYYQRDVMNPEVVLFRIEGEVPDLTLEVLEEDEFAYVSQAFTEQHQEMMGISLR